MKITPTPFSTILVPPELPPLRQPPPPPPVPADNIFQSVIGEPARPSLAGVFTEVLPRILTIETSAVAATNGFGRLDVKIGADIGRFRDLMIPYLGQKDHTWWETGLDVLGANAWDFIGALGTLAGMAFGKDVSGTGFYRFLQDIDQHGFFGVRVNGWEWKDGNYGSTTNTLHGLPYALLGSGWMRMRGYSPEISLLTGLIANVFVHEMWFERYEQPKSIYDTALMNTLGAIFGAFSGCGMEVQLSLFTKEPTATFYVEDGGNRYTLSFEQQRDFFEEGVPIPERPVLPWDVELGASIKAADGLDIGLRLRLTTDPNEPDDPLRAITGIGLGASIHYRLP
jgi:hypothetical protein